MRPVLFGLLAVVAGAAAVLSFAALDELGRLCGFGGLSPLLPVTLDAGAAAGSVAWLSRDTGPARSFGRALALVLLAGSVAGNALSHALSAYGTRPPWPVVVLVSAVAPAVLGAVVHLAQLAGTAGRTGRPELAVEPLSEVPAGVRYPTDEASEAAEPADAERWPDPDGLDEHGLSLRWADAPSVADEPDRAAELIAAGAGRRRLARELAVSEYEARRLLAARRNGHQGAGEVPGDG